VKFWTQNFYAYNQGWISNEANEAVLSGSFWECRTYPEASQTFVKINLKLCENALIRNQQI